MFNLQGKELIFDYTKRNTVHKPSVQSLCNFNFPIFLYHFLLTIDNPRWNGTKRSRVCATCIELLLGSVLALESGFHATRYVTVGENAGCIIDRKALFDDVGMQVTIEQFHCAPSVFCNPLTVRTLLTRRYLLFLF